MIELGIFLIKSILNKRGTKTEKHDWTPFRDTVFGRDIESSLGQKGLLYNSRLNVVSGVKATSTFTAPPIKTAVTSPVAVITKPVGQKRLL